jgi:hypothetical protein
MSEFSWDVSRKEKWIHLQKLVLRAWQNKGIAQSHPLADINTTAFLHHSVAVQGNVKIGAQGRGNYLLGFFTSMYLKTVKAYSLS